MDTPKLGNNTYKKVVPLKGRLLDKLKNEFKKELLKDDAQSSENEVVSESQENPNQINSKRMNQIPSVKPKPIRSEKKIIIQKVENVKIEAIQTTGLSSVRRISSFFEPETDYKEANATPLLVTQRPADENDAIYPENEMKPPSVENAHTDKNHAATLKLLSTKIPENIYNTRVPLKVVRTLKHPKQISFVNKRFHRVETFRDPEPAELQDLNDLSAIDIEIASLLPDIGTTDRALITNNNTSVSQIPPSKAAHLSRLKCSSSEAEAEFKGFESPCKEDRNLLRNLKSWKEVLQTNFQNIEPSTKDVTKQVPKELNVKDKKVLVYHQKSLDGKRQCSLDEPHQSVRQMDSQTKAQPGLTKKRIANSRKKEAIKVKENIDGSPLLKIVSPKTETSTLVQVALHSSNKISAIPAFTLSLPHSSESCVHEDPANIFTLPNNPLISSSTCSENLSEIVTEDITMNMKKNVASEFDKFLLEPKRRQNSSTAINRFGWQDDILAVIGMSRIKEIDEMLMKIPNLVTGNAIETENVELRLIIRHLLRKFKLKSLMETVDENMIGSFTEESSNDNDFPDSIDDSNNFPDSSAENSVDMSVSEDENNLSNGVSSACPSNFADEITENVTLTNLPTLTSDNNVSKTSGEDETFIETKQIAHNISDCIEKTESKLKENLNEDLHERGKIEPESSFAEMTVRKRKIESSVSKLAKVKKIKTRQTCSFSDGKKHQESIGNSSVADVSKVSGIKLKKLVESKQRMEKQFNAESGSQSLRSSSCSSNLDGSNLTPLRSTDNLEETANISNRPNTKQNLLADVSKTIKSKLEQKEIVSEPAVKTSLRQTTNTQELETNESELGSLEIPESSKTQTLQPSSEDNNIECEQSNIPLFGDSSDASLPVMCCAKKDSNNKRISRVHKESTLKKKNSKMTSKIFDSTSESEATPDNHEEISRNLELESRLSPFDSNSKFKSSIFPQDDIEPTDNQLKKTTDLNKMMNRIEKIKNKKFFEQPKLRKRETLRTSALKVKDNESSDDEDIQIESEQGTKPPVSSDPSIENSSSKKKFEPRKGGRRGRQKCDFYELANIEKKEFTKPSLEKAVEEKVPYDKIIEAIKCSAPARFGRTSSKFNKENEEKKENDLKLLKSLKFFRCGNCKFEVSKHMWIDHFNKHGGLAWIENFETPINIEDWNEALRRFINNIKIYDQTVLTCPNCQGEKKSALGHLSHILVCGEGKEVVEKRKVFCEMCNEKYFPFHATLHRNKCSGYQKAKVSVNDNDNEESSDEDKVIEERFNASGRTKRKAVKRAEKKFRKILNEFKTSDYLKVQKGKISCQACSKSNFQTQEEALDHVKTEHQIDSAKEIQTSDSDVEMNYDESSEETESSSACVSSEIKSSDSENFSDNDVDGQISSSKRARSLKADTPELRNGRLILTEYLEELRNNLKTRTIKWTRQFIDENWKSATFPELIPKYNFNCVVDPKVVLPLLSYKLKSMKFYRKNVDKYSSTYENLNSKEWKQLEIGDDESDKFSSTIYCGGSVSSLDWASVDEDLDFLAVSTNSSNKGIEMNLLQTSKSSLHLYEFKNLSNDNFQGFSGTSKLCYVIIINDGPIWSIQFHPSQSSITNRVGLLALTTANQCILVYSLPYLNNDKPTILEIDPYIICALERDNVLFNDEFLLQASKVAWLQKNASPAVLAAGYISGKISIWSISPSYQKENITRRLYPNHVIQAHMESVTALDFKATNGSEFHLLTASLDRKMKIFTFDDVGYQETSNFFSQSRVLCSEWWMHWPGFLIGFDDCFNFSSFIYRQPLEFGMRNSQLLSVNSSILQLSVNNWLNLVLFVTDSGEVLSCGKQQMLVHRYSDRWDYFNFSMISSTDLSNIRNGDVNELGVIFEDFKSQISQPKKQRIPPTNRINVLQINQVSFNRNEKSFRFYALGYETGFVRIKYLKNLK